MHILIAPNAFKDSLDAEKVALAIQRGFEQSSIQHTSEIFPVGDGGDGTAVLLAKRHQAERCVVQVNDALGRPITSGFALINSGKTALIEMADASGIRLLKSEELNPSRATSFGTGELIKHALDRGVDSIVLCMGGSATVDGGMGILSALGIRFLSSDGKESIVVPEQFANLKRIDISGLDKRILNCELTILCDVDNLLLGQKGAAAVFGPQKGATDGDVEKLDAGLRKFAEITLEITGKDMATVKYGGTAGGAAAGLYAFVNARLVNGIDYFLDLSGFAAAVDKADLVITGEGSIDEQTLQGKAPYGVALRAKKNGLPVIVFAGKVPLNRNPNLQKYFDVLLPIGHEPQNLPAAMKATENNLIRTAEEVAHLLALLHL